VLVLFPESVTNTEKVFNPTKPEKSFVVKIIMLDYLSYSSVFEDDVSKTGVDEP